MAGAVALALQSVYAADITVNQGEMYETDIIGEDNTTSLNNMGTVNNEKIVIHGGTFKNTGVIETGTLDLFVGGSAQNNNLGGDITADDEIIFRGFYTGATTQTAEVKAQLNTRKLSIIGTDVYRSGLKFFSTESLQGVEEIYAESNGQRTGLWLHADAGEKIRYDGTVTLVSTVNKDDARIEVDAGAGQSASIYVDTVVSDDSGKGASNKLQTTHASETSLVFEVGHIIVESGKLNLQTSGTMNNLSFATIFTNKR